MSHIGEIDLPDRLAPLIPRWATMIGVALLAAAGTAVIRFALQLVAPGAAAFILVFPGIMAATLFARWPAGLMTAAGTILYAWYYLFPVHNSFALENPAGAATLASAIISALLTVLLADLFRRSVRSLTKERDRQIAERDLFLEEFDHRVKNNFTVVASMLDLQRRRADPTTAQALTTALTRVESIARAHRHLYRGQSSAAAVDMRDYLSELCSALSDSLLLRGAITLSCASDPVALPRDRAVSIGLVINELVTNAAKHAFEGRDSGTIRVSLAKRDQGLCLTVTDDGTGMSAETLDRGRDGGLGQRLIEAFARQAGATLHTDSDRIGTTVTLALEP